MSKYATVLANFLYRDKSHILRSVIDKKYISIIYGRAYYEVCYMVEYIMNNCQGDPVTYKIIVYCLWHLLLYVVEIDKIIVYSCHRPANSYTLLVLLLWNNPGHIYMYSEILLKLTYCAYSKCKSFAWFQQ